MTLTKTAAAVALAVPLALGAGCADVERTTGLGTKGQVGAVGGATAGGLIAAAAGAHPAWIAGSVILGGLTGGFIGDLLDKRDKEMAAQSSYNAIESKGAGGQTAWRNPDSGNRGGTRIDRTYTRDGQRCKDFTNTFTADGKTETVKSTACQQADGSWKVLG